MTQGQTELSKALLLTKTEKHGQIIKNKIDPMAIHGHDIDLSKKRLVAVPARKERIGTARHHCKLILARVRNTCKNGFVSVSYLFLICILSVLQIQKR